jgi:hypothetical protein
MPVDGSGHDVYLQGSIAGYLLSLSAGSGIGRSAAGDWNVIAYRPQ